MAYPRRYHSRDRREWGRHTTFELALTVVVIVVVIVTLLVFLLDYHTVPLGGGPPAGL